MKRDKDCMRDVLLHIEKATDFDGSRGRNFHPGPDEKVGAWSAAEVYYNLHMLIDAGFVLGHKEIPIIGGFHIFRLTYEGHEFLDTIRDDKVWAKAKSGAKAVGGAGLGLVWEMGKQLLSAEAKRHLGLSGRDPHAIGAWLATPDRVSRGIAGHTVPRSTDVGRAAP